MLSMHETYLVTIPNRIVHASGKPTQSQSKSWGFLSSLDQHEMPSFVQWAALQLHALIPMPWWSSLLGMQMDSKVTARSLCLSSYPRRSHKKKCYPRRACVSLSSNCQDFLTLSPSPCCWVDLRSWLTWGRRNRVSLALSPIAMALQSKAGFRVSDIFSFSSDWMKIIFVGKFLKIFMAEWYIHLKKACAITYCC